MKPKGWRGESRRHSMARKGIGTAKSIKVNESSGLWFESRGSLTDVVSLLGILDFGNLLGTNEAKGYTEEEYELDANNVIVFPSDESQKTIEWLIEEYANGNQRRKNQVKKLLRLAVKQIESKIGKVDNVDVRIDLHKSRNMFKEVLGDIEGKKASGKVFYGTPDGKWTEEEPSELDKRHGRKMREALSEINTNTHWRCVTCGSVYRNNKSVGITNSASNKSQCIKCYNKGKKADLR